ncbi:hypothetical protein K445DRAFT_19273 [Daldinia sp. EC12]|nr:hypothetical protein F4774DRAFT_401858 [Daldinia eschscholtzii]OTB18671.1 hypothetical protein K445DRAFT_19273 [Daldinia sp. EC12]
MPKGYQFVRRGNGYITRNCRKQAHLEGHAVYVVTSAHTKTGIRVPTSIYLEVLENYHKTKDARAQDVRRKDMRLETNLRNSILSLFPQIPAEDITEVIEQTMKKNSGRVGRTRKLDIADKTRLAIRAHIRHRHTDYDKLLEQGVLRDEARKRVGLKVDRIVWEWGGGQWRTHVQNGCPK